MLSRALLVMLLVALATPPAAADAAEDPVDFRVVIAPGAPPAYEGPAGLATLETARDGERYAWRLLLHEPYTVGEFRVLPGAFDVERARQIVPMLVVPHEQYPLFTPLLRAEVWDVDGVPRYGLHNATADGDVLVIRLGIPDSRETRDGPLAATLSLERDVTPPEILPKQMERLTHQSFYQEANTSELALMDLVVCCDPRGDEVHNPTPVYHFLHKFPIQGLDPERDYRVRFTAEDWAGNAAALPETVVRTLPAPVVPMPTVAPLAPAPDALLPDGEVVIEALIDGGGSPLEGGDIRFFLDKREIRERLTFENGTFRYRPETPLAPGVHSIGVEATNAAGGTGRAAWTFTVAGAEEDARAATPGASVVAVLAGLALALVAAGGRRR